MLLLTMLMIQYPSDNYSDEDVRSIYGDLASDLARTQQLRAFPLSNGDHPAVAFRAFRVAADAGAE
jgi:hypothetical protein